MTKKLMALAFGGVAMLMAGPALADGYKRAPVAAACCDTNWNGVYFGGGFGWAALLTNQDDHWGSGNSNRQELGSDGAFGFLRVGLDRQIHSGFVLGAFADYEFHDIGIGGSSSNSSSRRQKKYYHYSNVNVFDLVENDASLDSTWAVGARLGLVRNCCTMWYLNGGYTQADVDRTFRLNNVTVVGSRNDVTVGGWFAGAGVEQQLGKGFFLSMEYRYASFETKDVFNGTYTLGGVSDTHRHEVDPIIHSVRFGLTYKFDVHHRAAAVPLK